MQSSSDPLRRSGGGAPDMSHFSHGGTKGLLLHQAGGLKRSAGLAQEFIGFSCLFCISILAIMLLAFCVDAPHLIDHAFLGALAPVCAWTILRCLQTRRFGPVLGGCALAAIVMAVCVIFQSATYDISFDGMSYHLVSVIAFLHGWNPLTAASVVDWLSAHADPQEAAFASMISAHGIWSDHYPKASWILGAAASALTGTIASANWVQPFLCVVSLVAAMRLFSVFGINRRASLALATCAALSPVVISQLSTDYVDGLVGGALLIEISGLSCWLLTRSRLDLATACAGLILASNFKFTGLVYGLIYVAGIFLYGLFKSALRRDDMRMILIAGMVSAMGCLPTYILNTMRDGHPFYPINKMNVMKHQQTDAFLAQSRLEKYVQANLQSLVSTNSFIDFSALRDSYYRLGVTPDARWAGFGGLFGFALVVALLSVVLSTGSRQRELDGDSLFLVLIITTLLSVVVNPEFWWVRFVPQLWFVPIFCCVLLLRRGRRLAAWCVFSVLGLSTLASAATWSWFVLLQIRSQPITLSRFSDARQVEVSDDYVNTYGLYTFYRIGTERGFSVIRAAQPSDGKRPTAPV